MKMVFCVAGQDGLYFWYDVVHLMQTQPSNQPSNHPIQAAQWNIFKHSGVDPISSGGQWGGHIMPGGNLSPLIEKLVYNLSKVRGETSPPRPPATVHICPAGPEYSLTNQPC